MVVAARRPRFVRHSRGTSAWLGNMVSATGGRHHALFVSGKTHEGALAGALSVSLGAGNAALLNDVDAGRAIVHFIP